MADAAIAQTPEPPYYAVIMSYRYSGRDREGFEAAAETMYALAVQQPGFLGMEEQSGADGFGITVSYWDSEASIAAWKAQSDHTRVRQRGRSLWYDAFEVRVARIERAYAWQHENPDP